MTALPTAVSPAAPLDAEAIRGHSRQHLAQQLEVTAASIEEARQELKHLRAWLATSPAVRLYDDDLDRSCVHTARLLATVVRLQAAQVANALALAKLDERGTVHRIVVERAG